MSGLLDDLAQRHGVGETPFLLRGDRQLRFSDIAAARGTDLAQVRPGDVVALIGDFDPGSILSLLRLFDMASVVVPLTVETRPDHEYFFAAAGVDVVIEGSAVRRLRAARLDHPMLAEVRRRGHPGLVLFSSGTTGRPKAILHDFEYFLARYRTPRPTQRTLNFLLFDHIGGVNTLLHTLYNRGVVVVPRERTPDGVLRDIAEFAVELLPTTPTFLRMMLMSGLLDEGAPAALKMVTYGTERMDQATLDQLCRLMPKVEFRQTFGMSELGILRVKSRASDSLWMKVGGEGVETRVEGGVLKLRSESRMLGYLNAPSPFDENGWYDTKDLVEEDGDWIKVVGRTSDVISVGGLKFLPSEVERAALCHPEVAHAKAFGADNPITGQHVELVCELREGANADKRELRRHMFERLPERMRPHRIRIEKIAIGHRFKKK
jgi:long-chain acyl-CoA synthetase